MDDLLKLLALSGVVIILFVIGGILVAAKIGERAKYLTIKGE